VGGGGAGGLCAEHWTGGGAVLPFSWAVQGRRGGGGAGLWDFLYAAGSGHPEDAGGGTDGAGLYELVLGAVWVSTSVQPNLNMSTDAEEGGKVCESSSGGRWALWITVALVGYVLSVGPVIAVTYHHYGGRADSGVVKGIALFYAPLGWAAEKVPMVQQAFESYMILWFHVLGYPLPPMVKGGSR